VRTVSGIEQLSGSGLAPRTGAYARQDLVFGVSLIISAAKRHQVLWQALREEPDDIAVLRRGGLVRVRRSFASPCD
jgi:hypothetical protein